MDFNVEFIVGECIIEKVKVSVLISFWIRFVYKQLLVQPRGLHCTFTARYPKNYVTATTEQGVINFNRTWNYERGFEEVRSITRRFTTLPSRSHAYLLVIHGI